MTDQTIPVKDRPLRDDDDLSALLEQLLQRASRRQVWLMFVDQRGCLAEPLIPIEGYPDDPSAVADAPDLGEVTEASLLMQRAGMLREAMESAAVVLVWERPGSRIIGVDDREWAVAMRDAAAEHAIPLRAQFVLHSRGVRQIHDDDLG
ncbi:MAG: hypothetical protein J7484_10510 [Microbacterium sp.]|nr:hypothetical protein [Microbacterium sp.]